MILGQLPSLELPIIRERRENDSPIITATFVTAWGFKLAPGVRVFATELPIISLDQIFSTFNYPLPGSESTNDYETQLFVCYHASTQ